MKTPEIMADRPLPAQNRRSGLILIRSVSLNKKFNPSSLVK